MDPVAEPARNIQSMAFAKGKVPMEKPVSQTDFDNLSLLKRGKVRDIYDLGENLLMVATDRISAFDVVMPNPIPDKGIILTQISLFWFDVMRPLIANHVITSKVDEYPEICRPYAAQLEGRSMLVKKTEPLPIECVVRGYLSGSGWKSYRQSGTVCGIQLPDGLEESDKLPEALFTPSTKADVGDHDINIDFDEAVNLVGPETARRVRDLSLDIYGQGAELADRKGIIIADTKFEFGTLGDELYLIDEVLTPDSSRFWPKASYRPGGAQASYDKQYLRDYLSSLNWDKTPPAPELPGEVVRKTRQKYLEALTQLTGESHGL
jgi:phosphoribosylaminoimidazole-succinocarboxamide synthase